MLRFYREYPLLIENSYRNYGNQPQITSLEKVPQAVAQLPWGHNIVLIERIKDHVERFWYAEKTLAQGWSRDSLDRL